MYQRIGSAAYRNDLGNIIQLCNIIGNPQQNLKCIHVAGTNGKGSVVHYTASVLQEAGYKVGVFVSPHYKDYRERIKINGRLISKQWVANFIGKNLSEFAQVNASFFEMTTAMAFAYFAEKKVDYAVIETGMGGRLDSTNIIQPILSVITNISYDHMQFLGNTLPKIAAEKAGIIKPNVPVVIGETHPETKTVFLEVARKQSAPITFADRQHTSFPIAFNLLPRYQQKNIITVLSVVEQLKTAGLHIKKSDIKQGITNVTSNTRFVGRWMVLNRRPKIIADSAHNIAGIRELMHSVKLLKYGQLHIVYGTVADKDVKAVTKLLPKSAKYYLCKADIPRAMSLSELSTFFNSKQYKVSLHGSVKKALRAATECAAPKDLVIVSGSVFVVAEII